LVVAVPEPRLLTIAEAVTEFGARLPFMKDEDSAWRAIRTGGVPALQVGRRRYVSTAVLEALTRGEVLK
jgi:hypothetical protein